MSAIPHKILVVANETVGGRALIEAVKKHAEDAHERNEPFEVFVACPQNQPKSGYVIYDESVRSAAENRLATTLAQLRDIGIEAEGDIMDPDPFAATTDAVDHFGADEIIVSTHPETRSGWLRQDLVTRVQQATRRPVEHVVVDLSGEAEDVSRTLVVANQTIGGRALIEKLEELAEERAHRFIVICPQPEEAGEGAAAERLARTLKLLQDEGIEATGQAAHPDPFTAIQQALQFFGIDEIVISTFPEARSGWMRADLIERVRQSTDKPVHHVVAADAEEATS